MPANCERPSHGADAGCAYIAAESWLPGAPPFCGAPCVPGSAYCAVHRSLCIALPASRAGRRIALEQALAGRRADRESAAATVMPERLDDAPPIDQWDLPQRHRDTPNEENA